MDSHERDRLNRIALLDQVEAQLEQVRRNVAAARLAGAPSPSNEDMLARCDERLAEVRELHRREE